MPRTKVSFNVKAESSKPHSKRSRTEDRPIRWFRSDDHEALLPQIKSRTIISGRYVLDDFSHLDLDTIFINNNIKPLMIIDDPLYPNPVFHFYCNASFDNSELVSLVKGITIRLNNQILANILGIPNEGYLAFRKFLDNYRFSIPDLSPAFAITILCGHYMTKPSLQSLLPVPRLFSHMLTHNILPKGDNRDALSKTGKLMVFALMDNWQINYADLILHIMHSAIKDNTNKILPFGRLLTKIFIHFGVDINGEEEGRPSDDYNRHSLRKMCLPTAPAEEEEEEEEEEEDDDDDDDDDAPETPVHAPSSKPTRFEAGGSSTGASVFDQSWLVNQFADMIMYMDASVDNMKSYMDESLAHVNESISQLRSDVNTYSQYFNDFTRMYYQQFSPPTPDM